MSLDPGTQFDETSLTAAEFNAQDKVLPNSPIASNDVNAIASRALRRAAYLNAIKANLSGATFTGVVTFSVGATVSSGQTLTLDGVSIAGDVGFSALGRVSLYGRKAKYRARTALSDANHTISVDDGDLFDLVAGPAAPRTITLKSTTIVPITGETLTFFWFPKRTAIGAGTQYTFQREDATVVAKFNGAATFDTGVVFAEFEFNAGVWRLGKCTPTMYDVAGTQYYGVVGGAGA